MTVQIDLPSQIADNQEIQWAIGRLRGITGFVSTVTVEGDPRASVYNRLDHVGRVQYTSKVIQRNYTINSDPESVSTLVWLHDLNRWPFAHNLERGRYDQAKELLGYLKARGVHTDEHLAEGFEAVHGWDATTTNSDGLLALAADKITGLLEDLMFATSGMNMSPRVLSSELLQFAGLEDLDPQRSRAADLYRMLNLQREIEQFQGEFDSYFKSTMDSLLARAIVRNGKEQHGLAETVLDVRRLRDTQIAPKVFPINNEHVGRKSHMEREVFAPLLASSQAPSSSDLLQLDDSSAANKWVADCAQIGVSITTHDLAPDLDFVTRTWPDAAFVRAT